MVEGRAYRGRLILAHAVLVGFIALVAVPLFMVVSISFRKGNFAVGGILPTPETFSLEHWRMVLGLPVLQADGSWDVPSVSVLRWFWNSVKVSATSAFLILALSSTCAYAFARMRFRGRERILGGLLILQMFPMVLALIAIYSLLEAFGRWVPALGLDTHPGLILAYLGGAMGANVWLLKGYFDTVPKELDEAAKIDGATHAQIFWGMIMRLVTPILAVVGLLSFVGSYGEFILARIVLARPENYTLAVGLYVWASDERNAPWSLFAAGAVVAAIPIVLLFMYLQKYIVAGLTAGGVKG